MISILLSARPSYAKLKPIIAALCSTKGYARKVEVVACGSAVISKYGDVGRQVARDFPLLGIRYIHSTLEGATLETDAKETGILIQSLSDHYARVRPALVVVMADRHETLAASIAAAYQNIPVAHIQGGERSGNIDDKVRDANTALATYHFPATRLAAVRLRDMGVQQVWQSGCPSLDACRAAWASPPLLSTDELGGVGPRLDFTHQFGIIMLHPETEHPDRARHHMASVLRACLGALPQVLAFWPGQDAGQEGGAKYLREVQSRDPQLLLHTVRTLPPERFMQLLYQAKVLVGNSSAGIRECSFTGTPVVNVGTRKQGRERAENVVDVPFETPAIWASVVGQAKRGAYPTSYLYGDGQAGPRIAAKLLELIA